MAVPFQQSDRKFTALSARKKITHSEKVVILRRFKKKELFRDIREDKIIIPNNI